MNELDSHLEKTSEIFKIGSVEKKVTASQSWQQIETHKILSKSEGNLGFSVQTDDKWGVQVSKRDSIL